MMVDATPYNQPLTAERLFGWQAPVVHRCSGMSESRQVPGVTTGRYRCRWSPGRSAANACISRPLRRAHRGEMKVPRVVQQPRDTEPVLKAGWRFWFVTIHPFDDGNGRIARAIADMSLASSEGSPQRFYSMSAQIRQARNDDYGTLEKTQRGRSTDPVAGMVLGCLGRAIEGAQTHWPP